MISLVAIFLIWILSGGIFGFMGAFLGPGAAVLILGVLMGICGGVIHIASRIIGLKLRWWYAGISIAVVSLLLTMVLIGGDTLEPVVASFLFVFYAVSSTIIFSYTNLITDD